MLEIVRGLLRIASINGVVAEKQCAVPWASSGSDGKFSQAEGLKLDNGLPGKVTANPLRKARRAYDCC